MKKINPSVWAALVLFVVVIVAMLSSCTGPRVIAESGTRFVQPANKSVELRYRSVDTLHIYKANLYAGALVTNHASSTDSVKVYGGVRTVDGKVSSYSCIAPGTSKGYGYNDLQRLDSCVFVIPAGVKADITLTPVK